jgi:prolyl-tRNA editing enzyme YbaK/EbsC (Cys-tRNA(Pro) deacylase)
MKTNAVRLLDTLGIRYELRDYAVDPDDLDAERVAAKIGLPAEQVFKTLVARGDRHGVCLAIAPSNTQVDEKALAACGRPEDRNCSTQGSATADRIYSGRGNCAGMQAQLPRLFG